MEVHCAGYIYIYSESAIGDGRRRRLDNREQIAIPISIANFTWRFLLKPRPFFSSSVVVVDLDIAAAFLLIFFS